MTEREKMMGEEKISSVLLKLSIPAIIGMLVNAIYNIVDTAFVGMLKNTSAIAAVSVAFPMFVMIGAIGLMFGIGAASYISRLLGEKNKKLADQTASTTFFTSLIFSMFFTIFGVVFIVPILKMFGATDTIMIFAKDYSKIIMFGSTFTIMNMTLNNMIRAEGNAKYSMMAMSIGALLNIILDPIFMFVFDMGIKGAAVATVVAQSISFIFLMRYYIFKKSYIHISIKYFSFSIKIYNEIMKIGLATFARQALGSFALGFINLAAKGYGDAAVAAMGISLRVFSLGMFVIFGYNQGFQPVVGYNYGAKKYKRLKEAIEISVKWTSIFCIIVTIVFAIFAKEIVLVFSQDMDVVTIGAKTLRVMSILFPLFGFQQVYGVLFQALGKGKEALALSVARQGIFLLPAIFILPKWFELDGVIWSQTVADLLTLIFTSILAIRLHKEIRKEMTDQRA
ncbi:MATE family efflux transporter [Inediibacterium massiliense]|uniref:MATE family efflux transporter n=1 Tax=Inediibacterium massiliense TaxID=1658111 RepID=UPI0006B542C4|nr:MATE family efflux transporter [Inediibacterium massiliense]